MSKAKGFTHEDRFNDRVEWYTPAWVFEALGLHFDLDPCAPSGGLNWIPASKSYSETDDGLVQPWTGRVWLNPPYGDGIIKWLAKIHEHRNGIAFVFARTDTVWYHEYITKADAVLYLKGRVKFIPGAGSSKKNSGPGSGSMLVAWGETAVNALCVCGIAGHLVLLRDEEVLGLV